MKEETFINEKQREYLDIFSHWIWDKISTSGGLSKIQVVGMEFSLYQYHSLISYIVDKDSYDKVEKDILNELRLRYMYNSLDYNLTMSI